MVRPHAPRYRIPDRFRGNYDDKCGNCDNK